MTFDPKHDYEDESSAKLRFNGKLQQPVPCGCHLCRMFELTEGPMLVPAMQTMPDGSRRFIGRWLHGATLKHHLEQRRRVLAQMKDQIAQHAMGDE
jgi:hypothetical protein